MKENHDPEKILLLNRDEQNEEEPKRSRVWWGPCQWRGLRNLVVVLVIYGAYTVAMHVLAPMQHDEHHHESLYWAKKAAWKQRGPLSPEKVEEFYLSIPDPGSALAISREYATHPHVAGSVEDLNDAKVILKLFQDEFGIHASEDIPLYHAGTHESRSATLDIPKYHHPKAWIDQYFPVMNTPLDRALSILGEDGKPEWEADLVEDGDPHDPDAAKYRDAVPTFHGFSADGEVEGQLVYVNYGRKEDYDELIAKGVNLTGKLVLARYGGVFRGLKIKGAQELGAVGVLIYDDPRDDGVVTVENGYKPYPEGPARNPTAVQRGSVQFISLYPGDPTTPDAPAYENATRTDGENIPKIPSLPISWENAQRLLKEISGKDVKAALTLNGKASEKKVKLVNHVDTKVIPIWNTLAVLPGHIKNETVLIGCHRDAWVMGATDPTSGTVSIHEVVRGYGALLRKGWRPLRNVVFASWDAEEYGLVGSTEWAEDFPEWITENVVAYINLDVSTGGSQWSVGASPSLAHLIRDVALKVPHPTDPTRTLWDARHDVGPYDGFVDAESAAVFSERKLHTQSDLGITPLGSGSDWTALLQHLGVASMNQNFESTLTDAVYHYHSVYDSQLWQERYADPGFFRHAAVAKHLGVVALRLADSIILPLNTTHYAHELDSYLDAVEDINAALSTTADFSGLRRSIGRLQAASKALDEEKEEAEKAFRELLDKIPHHEAHAHRHAHPHAHVDGDVVPHPDSEEGHPHPSGHGHSKCALHHHGHSSRINGLPLPGWLKKILEKIFGHGGPPRGPIGKFVKAAQRVQAANAKLVAFERGFISEEGIKDREWYRHLGVAPGKWLGYGATTLPSITEALTIDVNATLAEQEARRVGALLDKLTETIKV
ncbi:Zn-dependent exopeptidase [Dichomitus squalens]|uniref:Zn-dependent exopeptidase n=1 Tax=Dichomitus squalens TaxID=114155 RepID=A0A4Q9N347_9APHY|nr:Zn-dependent exopeptidase [Dichomitus squalens]